MENENYFDVQALSFSSLKNLQFNPQYFKVLLGKKPSGEALTIGSIVDTILTDASNFENQFLIKKAKEPTGMMLDYTHCLLKFDGDHEEAYKCSGYKTNKDNIREKFEKDCLEYYEEQKELKTSSKHLCTEEEYSKALAVVNSLQKNPITSKCFEALENEEIYKQLEIFWEYKGVKLKSKLDVLKINKTEKKIILYDLKTTGFSVQNFTESIIKYQYWLQMAMYGLAVMYHFKESIPNIDEYKIEFKWIVESTKYPGTPQLFKMSEKDAEKGIYGGKIEGKYYKGFIELIDDYLWYLNNNEWNYRRDVIQNNFEIDLQIFS